jgi:hypothetical protein
LLLVETDKDEMSDWAAAAEDGADAGGAGEKFHAMDASSLYVIRPLLVSVAISCARPFPFFTEESFGGVNDGFCPLKRLLFFLVAGSIFLGLL